MRYTSSASLFGLPLFELVLPGPVPAGSAPESPVARAWLAIGPVAVGVVAFGGVATGGLALGGLAFGALSIGGLAVGAIALGGGAIGWWAVGGGAAAVDAAVGGLAVATHYALGGAAFAEHANDAAAREFFASGALFPALRGVARHSGWFLVLLLLPVVWPFLARRRPGSASTPH